MILMEFICPVCRKFLSWTDRSAIVQCPWCTRWVRSGDSGNPAMIDETTAGDQLILFSG